MWFIVFPVLALLLQGSSAATAAQWRSRAIYQVLTDRFARTDGSTSYACDPTKNTYCGGTWKGLQSKLDYIKNMGFTAIWISPITAQTTNAYHGYYQTDLYSTNSNFGSAADLKSLADAVHSRGMYLMVDVVPNHMGWNGCHDTVNYANYRTFPKSDYFHTYCPMDNMHNQTAVEDCWLGNCEVSMPDLRTDNSDVQTLLNNWIRSLVSNYTVDGLRIDSVKNVNKNFFPTWCQTAGVFCMGEVSEGNATYTYPYQQVMDSILNYPLYYAITRVFQKQTNMSDLVVNLASCVENSQAGCKDSTLLGSFLENHDKPRFPSGTSDMTLAKNAIAFTILGDGIPIIYQGQEQHYAGGADPGCREAIWTSGYNTKAPLYTYIATINAVRNYIAQRSGSYTSWQTRVVNYNADTIQIRKDAIRAIMTNQGSGGGTYTLTTQGMQFNSGEAVVEVINCSKYTAKSNGEVDVKMSGGAPAVLVPTSWLASSKICGF